jgi:TonB-dependent starch-binding outer membrane protein SusC
VQLGYTLPERLVSKIKASRLRVYITSENLFTITGYTGYDPEIGGSVFGIDRGVYPQARSFIGGVQLQF